MTLIIEIKAIINTFLAPTEPIKASHISCYGSVTRSTQLSVTQMECRRAKALHIFVFCIFS